MLLEIFRQRQCVLNVLLTVLPTIKKWSRIDLLRECGVDKLHRRLEYFLPLYIIQAEKCFLLYESVERDGVSFSIDKGVIC